MPDSYTGWQRCQHDKDGGLSARLAVAHEHAAAEVRDLPETLMPATASQHFFAMTGTPEERRAQVDAWAARHHVTAGWVPGMGYCARVEDGPLSMIALALGINAPAAPDLAGYAVGRKDAILAALAEDRSRTAYEAARARYDRASRNCQQAKAEAERILCEASDEYDAAASSLRQYESQAGIPLPQYREQVSA